MLSPVKISRRVSGALCVVGGSTAALFIWRVLAGIAAAAVYVPLTGGIARWFPERERGLSQGTLGGVGGALGEGVDGVRRRSTRRPESSAAR